MWSVGCIFAELLLKEPLFQAKSEIELINMIFKLLGTPTSASWPEYSSLPLAKTINLPSPQPPMWRQKFQYMTTAGIDLLSSLLCYDPDSRISAEEALQHPYFSYVLKKSTVTWFDLFLSESRHSRSTRTFLAHSHQPLLEKSAFVPA